MKIRETFDAVAPRTLGIEEEAMLLDPVTLLPIPVGAEVAARDPRLKLELPAAQLELVSGVHTSVADAVAELGVLRQALADACEGLARPACAALHPTTTEPIVFADGPRYALTEQLHGSVARRQLIGALHVHVAVGGADRTLAVYDALRTLLPELAALAAAAPFHEGLDTGLASARPLVTGQMPRQGIPPAFESWAAFAAELEWGASSDALPDVGRWWWELRPHVGYGTLEIRVPDAQPTLDGTAAVAGAIFAIVGWLAARFDAGDPLPHAPTWRIQENRWAALRDGVEGTLADLEHGGRVPTRDRLTTVLDAAAPFGPVDAARTLVDRNAALDLRAAGLDGAAAFLAGNFLRGLS